MKIGEGLHLSHTNDAIIYGHIEINEKKKII